MVWAGLLYAAVITLTAATLGMVENPVGLALYAGSGGLVTFAITRNIAGQFSASVLQGILSIVLIFYFGPAELFQMFAIFMLLGHLILPGFLWHWIELIHGAHR